MPYRMICEACGNEVAGNPADHRCSPGPKRFAFEYDTASATLTGERSGMWAYADLLPVSDSASIVSMGEGGTPVVPSRLVPEDRLWWKLDLQNPTGSHKDRALSLTITKALELGLTRVVIASTGSAGLACAAYAARAQLPCIVLVPQGTPHERLRPMSLLGAKVVEIQGTMLEVEDIRADLASRQGWCDATTQRLSNPFHSEATRTIAFEMIDGLPRVPDWIVVPVGGGGSLVGIAQGLRELQAMGRLERLPRIAAVQPERFSTLEVALERGIVTQAELDTIAMDESVETVMRNLKHATPPDGVDVLAALRDVDGIAVSVSEEQALDWQQRIARQDGLFCEPSASAAGAAAEKMLANGIAREGDLIAGLLTGSGFREVGSLGDLPTWQIQPRGGAADLERILDE